MAQGILFSLKETFAFRQWEFDLALKYLRNKRKNGGIAVIAIISFVGISLAFLALIATLSIMNGFQSELMSRLLSISGHAYVYGPPLNDLQHRDAALARIRHVPGVKSAEPIISAPGLAIGAYKSPQPVLIRGVMPAALKSNKLITNNLRDGGDLNLFGTGDYGGDFIVVGSGLADNLGLNPGDRLSLATLGGASAFGSGVAKKPYLVAAIFHSGVSDIDDASIFMPLAQAQLFFGREDDWDTVEIKVNDPMIIESIEPGILKEAGPGARLQNWKEVNGAIWNALKFERNAMRFILFFVILIAALNIVSGIVMLVKNKTRDIAILRTLGAGRASITRIFFMAGAMIGAAGTGLGLVLGVLFVINIHPIQTFIEWITHSKIFDSKVYFLSQVPARLDVNEISAVVLFSLGAACLFSIFPARWASRMQPVEALRYE